MKPSGASGGSKTSISSGSSLSKKVVSTSAEALGLKLGREEDEDRGEGREKGLREMVVVVVLGRREKRGVAWREREERDERVAELAEAMAMEELEVSKGKGVVAR